MASKRPTPKKAPITKVLAPPGAAPADAPGVVLGTLPDVVTGFTALLATHRVWHRFPATAEPVPA